MSVLREKKPPCFLQFFYILMDVEFCFSLKQCISSMVKDGELNDNFENNFRLWVLFDLHL